MNLGEAKTRLRRTFGDESSVQVTDADIVRWVNDGQREVVMQNPSLLEKITTANIVAAQDQYTYPTDMRQLRSLSYKSTSSPTYIKMQGMSLQEFDQYMDGWDGDLYGRSDPLVYCTFANLINVFPTPQSNATAGLKLYYFRQPVDLVNDSDIIDLPVGYHSAIVEYCLKMAYELDEDWTSVGNKAQEFNAAVSGQRNQEKDNSEDSYKRITVMREDEDWY